MSNGAGARDTVTVRTERVRACASVNRTRPVSGASDPTAIDGGVPTAACEGSGTSWEQPATRVAASRGTEGRIATRKKRLSVEVILRSSHTVGRTGERLPADDLELGRSARSRTADSWPCAGCNDARSSYRSPRTAVFTSRWRGTPTGTGSERRRGSGQRVVFASVPSRKFACYRECRGAGVARRDEGRTAELFVRRATQSGVPKTRM